VGIALAEALRERGEDPVAISADALQVYDGLATLTGAASREEQDRLEHRLVGFLPLTETFSVGEFMPLAHAEIDAALANGRTPIVLGGTGLYLRAALTDLSLKPPPPAGLRERLERELAIEGPAKMHDRLLDMAPGVAAAIEPTDRSRVIRALELAELGELDPAGAGEGAESELWTAKTRHPTLLVGLVMEREALYAAIDHRVDTMVLAGAADEVRRADGAGASRTARAALGFQDLLDDDVAAMKRRTRNYAKRQLTWMRKLPGVLTVDVTEREPVDVAAEIERAAGGGA
jgi:tRNA dimethylallyltransferase